MSHEMQSLDYGEGHVNGGGFGDGSSGYCPQNNRYGYGFGMYTWIGDHALIADGSGMSDADVDMMTLLELIAHAL